MFTLILVLLYLVAAVFAYTKEIKNWVEHSKAERIYFSLIWIFILPIQLVQWISDKVSK